jgi:cell division initiation protein
MAVNRIDLLNHTFSRVLRGYDPEEVDSYLQDIADTMAQLGDERVRLANLVAQLEERLAAYGERENALRETLLVSQRMMEEIKSSAQKEAQLIIDAAQNRAENLTNQANLRLARILDEISEARKLKAQFEFKVRSVIEGHLKLLELGQMEDARMERATAALNRRSDIRNEAAGSDPGSGPGGHGEQRDGPRNKNDGHDG